MRILLTVIFGSALLFSCTKNPTGLAACKQFEKDFTFVSMQEASRLFVQTIMPKFCVRAKTAIEDTFTENTPCEPGYIACVAIGASADDKAINFLYDEAGKTMIKRVCDQKDVDCDWYQD